MSLRDWTRPPRHLLVLFVAVTAVSAAALGWASWQLVRQDRELGRQRAQQRRDAAATLAAGELQRTIDALDAELTALGSAPRLALAERASDYARTLPDEAVLLVIQAHEVAAYPAGRLRYYPVLPPAADVPAAAFAAADVAEFQQNDHAKAMLLLRPLAAAGPPAIRAEALLRIARNQRKAGRWQQALETYHELARLDDVRISDTNGAPAGLVARAAMCDVLAAQNDGNRLVSEARALQTDLGRGRWRVLRSVYDVYSANARKWLAATAGPDPASNEPSQTALVLAETAREIWGERRAGAPAARRDARWVDGTPVLVVERQISGATIALAARPSFVTSSAKLNSVLDPADARITLADAEGRLVLGAAVPDKDYTVRLGSATGLPWTVYATSAGDPAAGPFTLRNWIVVAGLSAIVLLVTGGSYLIGRAVMRELRVARLQSDFVSAVSHEFRTPLTALRQMSELLVQGRVGSDDVRQQYYEVLQHESGRLQRLVEGLLKFGRMEADALPFQFEPVEADAFVRGVVNEFRREAARQGYEVVFEATGTAGRAKVDREALACVLWNLLDNAMKYSPECRTIRVSLEHSHGRILIQVRDQGVGIPDADRSRIFDKFVRGESASSLGVPGTGIGLAVSRQIVLRHGGDITVESTPGGGATFTVALPGEEAAGRATDAEVGTPQVSRST